MQTYDEEMLIGVQMCLGVPGTPGATASCLVAAVPVHVSTQDM
jgi:hypothetical protein